MLTHNNILAGERAYCARLNSLARCVPDACATGPTPPDFYTASHFTLFVGRVAYSLGHLYPRSLPYLISASNAAYRNPCQARRRFIYDLLCAVEQQPADLSSQDSSYAAARLFPKGCPRLPAARYQTGRVFTVLQKVLHTRWLIWVIRLHA